MNNKYFYGYATLEVEEETLTEQFEDLARADAIPDITDYFKGEINDDSL